MGGPAAPFRRARTSGCPAGHRWPVVDAGDVEGGQHDEQDHDRPGHDLAGAPGSRIYLGYRSRSKRAAQTSRPTSGHHGRHFTSILIWFTWGGRDSNPRTGGLACSPPASTVAPLPVVAPPPGRRPAGVLHLRIAPGHGAWERPESNRMTSVAAGGSTPPRSRIDPRPAASSASLPPGRAHRRPSGECPDPPASDDPSRFMRLHLDGGPGGLFMRGSRFTRPIQSGNPPAALGASPQRSSQSATHGASALSPSGQLWPVSVFPPVRGSPDRDRRGGPEPCPISLYSA